MLKKLTLILTATPIALAAMSWKGALVMPKKRFSAEQIVVMLRQIEVLLSQGKSPPVACREAGISQQSYYRWRNEYGVLILLPDCAG